MLNFEAATTFINQNLLQNLSLNKQKFGTTMYFPENLENTPLQRKGSKLHFCQLGVPIMVQITGMQQGSKSGGAGSTVGGIISPPPPG